MMRNVAIGAVIGFAIMVTVLTFTNQSPPPLAPAAPPAPQEPARSLQVNTAPVLRAPNLLRNRSPIDPAQLQRVRREALVERAPDGGS